MVEKHAKGVEPLVSVLIATYNRRKFLPVALSSVIHQDYTNLEIFVIRDGGESVSDIVKSFDDARIVFIDRSENRGLPFTLNQGLAQAQGKYICYLGDDDLYYPDHVSTLVDALENKTDCHVAYGDLYKTYCRVETDGRRQALSKIVEVCRDFDRFLMLFFNHVLHVSLMHRRDLLEKIGPYNENLNVLIDWDLTRRLVFFSDFYHVHKITGEFYSPVGESDRISVQRRKDEKEYYRNVMAIRTTRPAKPWSKMKDLSIIFLTERLNKQSGQTLGLIWRHTFYPYQVYLPIPTGDVSKLDTDMPGLITVDVGPNACENERIDAALAACEGEYVAIVPSGFFIREFWVEDCLHALINSSSTKEGFELEGSTDQHQAVLVKKADLNAARQNFPHLSLTQSLQATGVNLRRLQPEEIPFQYDQLLHMATQEQDRGNWSKAVQMYEYAARNYQNEFWVKTAAAKASFKGGNLDKADQFTDEINQLQPTPTTLLLQARVKREKKNFNSAIELLEKAKQILEESELVWT